MSPSANAFFSIFIASILHLSTSAPKYSSGNGKLGKLLPIDLWGVDSHPNNIPEEQPMASWNNPWLQSQVCS